jgi:hypothetical protein
LIAASSDHELLPAARELFWALLGKLDGDTRTPFDERDGER